MKTETGEQSTRTCTDVALGGVNLEESQASRFPGIADDPCEKLIFKTSCSQTLADNIVFTVNFFPGKTCCGKRASRMCFFEQDKPILKNCRLQGNKLTLFILAALSENTF